MTPISRVRSVMLITMVFVMPMAATKSEMAPSPPSMSCCWAACCSIGLRMDSIEEVENPMALMEFSALATLEMSSTFTVAWE